MNIVPNLKLNVCQLAARKWQFKINSRSFEISVRFSNSTVELFDAIYSTNDRSCSQHEDVVAADFVGQFCGQHPANRRRREQPGEKRVQFYRRSRCIVPAAATCFVNRVFIDNDGKFVDDIYER